MAGTQGLKWFIEMAKSKNHTSNNDGAKAHRNGIKKIRKQRKMSTKGMDPKYLRNRRWAMAGTQENAADKAARIEKQKIEHSKQLELAKARAEAKKKEYAEEKERQMMSKA